MIRFLLRAAAFLLLAAGFVALILDGARSIAANEPAFLDAGALAAMIAPQKFALLQPAAERLSPAIWDPVLVSALKGPAFLYLALIGLILLWLTRPPAPKIGYSSRP